MTPAKLKLVPNESPALKTLKASCSRCSLKEICLPRGLSNDDINKIETVIKSTRTLNKGEYLFQSGAASNTLYAVRSGSMKTLATNDNGDEQITGFHLPGELLGLDGLEQDRHICSAIALEQSSICILPFDKIDMLCQKLPSLRSELYKFIGRLVTDQQALLLLLGNKRAEEKLANFLLSLSKRHALRGFSPLTFVLKMTRNDIGNYLGLTVETISRLFTRFQQQGLITVARREITLIKLEALSELSPECKVTNT